MPNITGELPAKNKKTVLIITFVAVILLLIIGVTIFYVLWVKNIKVEKETKIEPQSTAQEIIEKTTDSATNATNIVNNTIQKATDAVKNLPNTNPYKKVNPF